MSYQIWNTVKIFFIHRTVMLFIYLFIALQILKVCLLYLFTFIVTPIYFFWKGKTLGQENKGVKLFFHHKSIICGTTFHFIYHRDLRVIISSASLVVWKVKKTSIWSSEAYLCVWDVKNLICSLTFCFNFILLYTGWKDTWWGRNISRSLWWFRN